MTSRRVFRFARRVTRAIICLLAPIAWIDSASQATVHSSGARDAPIAALRVLDQAIRSLARAGSDYRRILQDTAVALPAESIDSVRPPLQHFLARLPQPGPDYRCSEEFTRARVEDLLWRLRDLVMNAPSRPLEPAVCYAVPFAVDLMRAQTRAEVVDIYGYDFDATPLQLVVITTDGFVDATPKMTVKSHTHLTVTVGGNGVPATATSQSLGVVWGHVIHYRVPLVSPTTSLCSSRIETIDAGRTVTYEATTQATRRAGGIGATEATLRLDYSTNLVQAALCVTATDAADSGCFNDFFYTTEGDRTIEGVIGPMRSQVAFRDDGRAAVSGPRGLVRQWNVARPAAGSTKSALEVVARLEAIRVVSTNAEGCVTPIAYQEARRTATFSATTRQRLDDQLTRVDRAILTLRPLFAPPPASR